ncbi:nucleolar protein 10-like [Tropilaelaps mercedesae]|uniref:Nucleolar protein 10 n=1 Tax=Tropilaelaps mercedesae TaxID=418985 RepID=A0A1V9XCX1_9ACAR|nr:nucleolar protein 10-like [Tropilaelaps mercedesae]
MEVCSINDVKIYNLSAGKSLPDWLTDRKKRALVQKDSKVRHRIELIQELEMPTVTTHLRVTPDRQYILACGVYKPRIRCFEVAQLSMKFERCLDYEVVAMEILADDYSKMVFLSAERYVEFHARYGRYHRLRIPRNGRDMAYCQYSAELLFAGDGSEVYRLNLEQGQFFKAYESQASAVNCVRVQTDHNLIVMGTNDGTVEAWDPRCRANIGVLPVGAEVFSEGMKTIPGITKVVFRDALTIGVGTTSGHVLLYDIRSNKPYLRKDHMYSLPIRSLDFHNEKRVIAADAKAVKIYGEDGKIFTSITTAYDINDVTVFDRSGLLFVATESPKIQPFYIPALGTAPRWCSFLDNITEELEETDHDTIYDDYRFVTVKELEELNLTSLIGTSMLRAYMHGYFIDIRLYHKAKELSQPFAFEEYKKKKIKERIDAMRGDRVPDKRTVALPAVNARVAQRLIEKEQELKEANDKKRLRKFNNPMKDARFAAMFSNPEFEVDEDAEDFARLRSVIATLQKPKKGTDSETTLSTTQFQDDHDDEDGVPGTQDGSEASDISDMDDYDGPTVSPEPSPEPASKRQKFAQAKDADGDGFSTQSGSETLRGFRPNTKNLKKSKMSLDERLRLGRDADLVEINRGFPSGNRMMTYQSKKQNKEDTNKKHMQERRSVRRSTKGLFMNKM